jgi:hypothetical protein
MLLNEIDSLIIEVSALVDVGKGLVRSLNPLAKTRHTASALSDSAYNHLTKLRTAVNLQRNRQLLTRKNNQSIGADVGKIALGLGGLGAVSMGTNALIKGAYDKYNPINNPVINANSSALIPTGQKIISNIPKLIKT